MCNVIKIHNCDILTFPPTFGIFYISMIKIGKVFKYLNLGPEILLVNG